MSSINLEKLKQKNVEILKAEIGALLFNLGKTHAGFGGWRKHFIIDQQKTNKRDVNEKKITKDDFIEEYKYEPFSGYRDYYTIINRIDKNNQTPFEIDLEAPEKETYKEKLKEFFKTEVKLWKFKDLTIRTIVYGNAISDVPEANNISEDVINFVQGVFFRGCENINSGIDKGAPKDQLKRLWISNAFGGYKKEISFDNLDKRRRIFFNELSEKINEINKEIKDFTVDDWIALRKFVFEKIKEWYSDLLSDSRFPINDVTLWDQAYMTTSLFKASLASIILDDSKLEEYMEECKKKNKKEPNFIIKWSILGVQYDKLGLAERALKPYFIEWYRSAIDKVDDKVKRIIEIEYALGNEIYRDETGIYFIVPENISGQNEEGYNLELGEEFYELKEKIIEAFKEVELEIEKQFANDKVEIFENQFFPSIFVTKPSRGTMNIAYLLEKNRENFLKTIYPKDFVNRCKEEVNKVKDYDGLCQVCKIAVGKKREDIIICEKCEKRRISRINNWIKKLNDENEASDEKEIDEKKETNNQKNKNGKNREINETIWTGDLQDENGKIALVTVKFELKEWLNGNMLNTFVINTFLNPDIKYKDYEDCMNKMKDTLLAIKKIKEERGDDIRKYKEFKGNITELRKFIKKIDSLLKIDGLSLSKTIQERFEINWQDATFKLETDKEKNKRKIKIPEKLGKITDDKTGFKDFVKIFGFNIFLNLSKEAYNGCKNRKESIDDFISQILLERTIGDIWEDFITNYLIKGKIDFNNNKIEWDKLSKQDVDFLAELLLQFLLRKNPSPARFRRIWETTEQFLDGVKNELKDLMEIEKWRTKRIVWKGIVKDEKYKRKEYTYKGLDFWVDEKGDVYLISSIGQAISTIGDVKGENDVKNIENMIEEDKTGWIKEFTLKEYDTHKDTDIKLSNINAEYKTYLPYLSIIDPTPISWQFIIPAEYLPNVINGIQEKYKEDFKYVVGKLPLHIGVIIQDYKSPLYIGLKALRKIRRDINDWEDIKEEKSYQEFKKIQGKYLNNKYINETNNPQDYYCLYPVAKSKGDNKEYKIKNEYEFYIQPSQEMRRKLVKVDATIDSVDENYGDVKLEIYPNTFDFEFLDANIRRNDIYYEKGKRILQGKSNRPYTWEEWEDFKKFEEYFNGNKDAGKQNINKLNNMVSLIYSKIKDWEGNDESLKKLMLSSFINIFELNDKDEQTSKGKRDNFAKLFGEDYTWEKLETMSADKFKKLLWKFIDMYEFWHKALKKF